MQLKHPLAPCLWFDTKAEDATNLYCSVFPNSRIAAISRFPDGGRMSTASRGLSDGSVVFTE